MLHKKALSEMISYVLLIVIAVSISILVYAWMNDMLPSKKASCPDGVSLIIENYNCNSADKIFNLTLRNMGTYNVDGYFIYVSNKTGKKPVYPLKMYDNTALEVSTGQIIFKNAMKPNDKEDYHFLYDNVNSITAIEIEPIKYLDDEAVTCAGSAISQEISGC
jgi:hypothetical protein